MTFSAIAFFGLVVCFELYLILWVPVQLKREGVLEAHVARENVSKKLDFLRGSIRYLKLDNDLKEGEVFLAVKVFNNYASYLRRNQEKMSVKQLNDLYAVLNRYETRMRKWGAGKFAFRKLEFSMEKSCEEFFRD